MGDKLEVRTKLQFHAAGGGIAGADSWHWALPHESAPDDGIAHAVTDTSVAPSGAGMIDPRAYIIVFV
jgi:hypothetical protein